MCSIIRIKTISLILANQNNSENCFDAPNNVKIEMDPKYWYLYKAMIFDHKLTLIP